MIDEQGITYRRETVGRNLDERGQRLFAAAEVRAAGHGGLKAVSRITGLARSTINRGEDDLDGEPLERGRVRREGGGRKIGGGQGPRAGAGVAEHRRSGYTRRSGQAADLRFRVYDVTANEGFVSVGVTADTAEFAVQSIRTWRERMGTARYPKMNELTITADCGGSNGARVRLWKLELQKLADETGLTLRVHHYPPGTSKWNKIEHRLFCHITQNWRGRPLMDHVTIVETISATTTKTGLKVECALDTRTYEKGIKVSKAQMRSLAITGDDFHPEWNYTIRPRRPDT